VHPDLLSVDVVVWGNLQWISPSLKGSDMLLRLVDTKATRLKHT